MRAQQYLPPHRPRRAGFTMIEILIVIVIIGILATLTFRGITTARERTNQARETNDITQLGIALETFRSRFGVYPPSRIRLRENSAYQANDPFDQHSVTYLRRIWPNIQLPNGQAGANAQTILWCQDNVAKTVATVNASSPTPGVAGSTDGTTYELEGDECLVFFLGGIPTFNRDDPTRPVILNGFTMSAINPGGIPDSTDPNTIQRDGPFFEFEPSRLFVRDGSTQVLNATDDPLAEAAMEDGDFTQLNGDPLVRTAKLPSYRSQNSPEANPVPVAYFSAYEGRGYRPMDCAFPRAMVTNDDSDTQWLMPFQITWPLITQDANGSGDPHPLCPGPNPYTITRSGPDSVEDPTGSGKAADTDFIDTPGALVKPFAAETYQLISPGADGKFGHGGKIPPPTDMTSADPAYDNVSSITSGSTVGAFSEKQRAGK